MPCLVCGGRRYHRPRCDATERAPYSYLREDASTTRGLPFGPPSKNLSSFIIGEIALGHLKKRDETAALLGELPALAVADHDQALHFAGRQGLAGSGIGWVDAHLLCAASAGGVAIWTHDRHLRKQAARLGLLHSEG